MSLWLRCSVSTGSQEIDMDRKLKFLERADAAESYALTAGRRDWPTRRLE